MLPTTQGALEGTVTGVSVNALTTIVISYSLMGICQLKQICFKETKPYNSYKEFLGLSKNSKNFLVSMSKFSNTLLKNFKLF